MLWRVVIVANVVLIQEKEGVGKEGGREKGRREEWKKGMRKRSGRRWEEKEQRRKENKMPCIKPLSGPHGGSRSGSILPLITLIEEGLDGWD